MKTTYSLRFLFLVLISVFAGIHSLPLLHADETISAVPPTAETIPLAPQLDSSSAVLTPPEVSINGAGDDYLPNLEKMQKHLKESNLLEFYLEAGRFAEKIKFTRKEKRIGTYQLNGKEEHIACEWFSYFLVKAPLFSDEMSPKISGTYKIKDIELKEFALDYILAGNIEKRSVLLGVDKRKLRTLYLNYAKIILKKLKNTQIDSGKLKKADWNKFLEEEKTWKSIDSDDDEFWRRKKISGNASGLFFFRGARIDECRIVVEKMHGKLLLRLLEEYPQSASRIHAYFFEIGYTKDQLVRIFQEEARSWREVREAKYLFDGLPKLKD
jgi:hypothetical protein